MCIRDSVLCFCLCLSCTLGTILIIIFILSFYSTLPSKFALISHPWNEVQLNWIVNALCSMVSICGQTFFPAVWPTYWGFLAIKHLHSLLVPGNKCNWIETFNRVCSMVQHVFRLCDPCLDQLLSPVMTFSTLVLILPFFSVFFFIVFKIH